MSYNGLLCDTCSIQRKSVNTAESHGYTAKPTWTTVYENVPCRGQNLFESSAGLRIQTGGDSAENDYLFFFKKTQNIQVGDRLIWNGLTLFVKPVSNLFSRSKLHHKEIYCGLSET